MLKVAQRFWESGPQQLEGPFLWRRGFRLKRGPIKHYGKVLAAVMEWERDFLLWAGHKPSPEQPSQVVLNRAIEMLLFDRWEVVGDERVRLDDARYSLMEAIQGTPPDLWDEGVEGEEGKWIVFSARAAAVRSARSVHPCLESYLWRARGVADSEAGEQQKRAGRLAREMSEGSKLPLDEKVRRNVSAWKRRGLLPPGPPGS